MDTCWIDCDRWKWDNLRFSGLSGWVLIELCNDCYEAVYGIVIEVYLLL